MVKLYPYPQSVKEKEGIFKLPGDFKLLFEYRGNREIFRIIEMFSDKYTKMTNRQFYAVPDYAGKLKPSVFFSSDDKMSGEEYKIKSGKKGIYVTYGENVGAYRGMTTLCQLIKEYGFEIPYLDIHDYPDIKKRGFMLDISRNKVPRLSEIFKLIDILSELKYNEFQLYLENFSFEYCAYPEYSKDIQGLTPFEVIQIVNYCKERYIEVVPNQNSFGHLYAWVQRPELKDLAVMDDSYCINPADERSYKLLNNIYDSLLPCFESKIFNVGCDEVGDLEVGKTKEECEKIGVENVYLNHILKLYDMLKSRDKRMMMWADVVFNHPACIEKLPKDLIPLIWGYEAETDFDSSCKKLRECGLEYYVCPGTASWASILGDNDKMRKNLYNAANGCIKYGGLGFLLTDWGDAGHGQFPIISYQSIAYGGGVTWCIKKNKELEDAQDYADKYIFKSINKSFARILYKASRLIPKSGNTTDPFLSMLLPFENMDLISRIKEERLDEVEKELNKLVEQAQRVVMDNEDASLIIDEFRCNAEQFLILNELFRFKYEKRDTGKIKNLEQRLQKFEQRIKEAEVFYTKVWNKRNLETGSEAFWKYVRDGVKRVRDSEKKEETKLNK